MATVKLQLNNSSVISKRILKSEKFTRKYAEVWRRYLTPYVPRKTGNLAVVAVDTKPGEIHYNAPYAKKMFNGISKFGKPISYNKSFHPKAGSRWDRAGQKEANKVAKEMTVYLRSM